MLNKASQQSIFTIDPATIHINKICPSTTETKPTLILSDNPLSDWCGSVTSFAGFTKTRPARELKDASWEDICNLLRPDRPVILSAKEFGVFVVPCLLKEAPLVGVTLDIAKYKGDSTVGKMRSKDHVTEASMLMIDIDGLPESELMVCLEQLKAEGITFVAYTTFSHGSPEKPGMRVRLVIPLDHPVSPLEYTSAWYGFDIKFLNGQARAADPSGAKLYQQQGTWCCHPSRISLAKSWEHNGGGVASAGALIKIGLTVQPSIVPTSSGPACEDSPATTFPVSKIILLLEWVDPDLPYPEWRNALMAVFNTTTGSHEGLEIVDAWSSKGGKYKDYRDIQRMWRSFRLDHPCPVKIGTLIKMARDAGADIPSILHGDSFEVCESEEDSDESDPVVLTEISPVLSPLAAMQQKFGMINFGGKLCVFDREALAARTAHHTARKLFLSNRSDGSLLIERAVLAEFPNAIDVHRMVSEFFVSPQTVCYQGTEFNPQGTSPNYLNLWEGPAITPVEGHWLLIQEFLHDVICNGGGDSYLYLLCFIAHALQKPEEKPGVMVILLSGQGTGKGTLGRILQKIWSATFIQVNNIDAVIGTFNAVLERSYIVFMDEALFAGNRRGTDELKSIVTESIIQISEKYQPSRQIRSCHRFIAATNADHFKNTERDDRRDFTLRVSEARKGDHEYWKVLNDEIENGGVEAMVYDLLLMDLTDFNVRNKPNTRELVEQKIHSLDPIQRWWHDCLYNGCIDGQGNWPQFLSTQEAILGIHDVNGGRMHKKPSAITIAQALHKLCPSATQHQQTVSLGGRQRGYLLPPLLQARAEFEGYLGGAVEWPDSGEADGATHGPLGDDSACCAPEF